MPDAYLLVLHSHLPYVRGAGRWPHGEEWVHEAILGTYLPLLVALHDLRDDGVPFRLTVGLTPTLLEQLAHPEIQTRFVEYIDDQIARVDRDRGDAATVGRRQLAELYRGSYRALREAFLLRFGRDLPNAFADLASSGHLEILSSAATHGYLPLLDERSVHDQLALGLATTRRLTGTEPRGIWLPECAYRPGLERILEAHGIEFFFTDAPLLAGAGARALTANAFAAGGSWSGSADDGDPLSTPLAADVSRPYLVGESRVAAIARHPEISALVWSARLGYPGDPAYREFHRKDARSGQRYWSVTDPLIDLGSKAEYHVGKAAERVRAHAAHFASRVRDELARSRARTGSEAMVATTFDSELFGHWWFEGTDWLPLVLRELAGLTATTSERLAVTPPRERVSLREGSWGKRSDHSTWRNGDTEWLWRELDRLQREVSCVRAGPALTGIRARAASQALRELLLAQSSDWPFLITTGQAREYAAERFRVHAMRVERAIGIAQHGTADDEPELRTLERIDDPFPGATLAGSL